MPSISTCPSCGESISLPSGLLPGAAVRCPLCGADYALREAIALAPPELIPLEAPNPDAGLVVETPPPEIPESESITVSQSEPMNEAMAVAAQFMAMATSMQPLQRRKPKSGLWTLFEVITGGVAGCLVAYYGLAFWFGPQFHNVMPRVPFLPFIDRITASPKANGAPAEPAPEKPAKNKGGNESKPKGNVPPDTGPRAHNDASPDRRVLLQPSRGLFCEFMAVSAKTACQIDRRRIKFV